MGMTVVSTMTRFRLALLISPGRTGRFNGDRQQGFHAFFANALSPPGQAGRINGQLGLQSDFAAEVLPVGVLQPSGHHRFIAGVVGMLQVQQAGDEARRQGRTPAPGCEVRRKAALDLLPVHQDGQSHQGVAHVDLLIQAGAQQFTWFGLSGLWGHHQNLIEIWQEIKSLGLIFLQIQCCRIRKNLNPINQLRFVQRGLFTILETSLASPPVPTINTFLIF